ncbi:LAMI_0B08526g1_1 [Lachancea mirantina]|uniref:LAMI_0B08526g1_1 n=1 Tax=Lachancea mirantina TaxID=1230905 RepID=A0A1G4IY24_9SACH|nr:LAMI_0B08526g1_1 [Lachancea mirantina]
MAESAPGYSKLYMAKEALYGFRPCPAEFLPKDYPDLSNKLAVVTGMNTGIGLEVVKLLYSKNCNVIGVVRSTEKGLSARTKILEEIKESKGSIEVIGNCELSDLTTIKSAASEITRAVAGRPISIIIHNAGIMPESNRGVSKQGHELIFATNVMGPQLLQHFLDPLFLKSDDSLKRIVWVSSGAHFFGFSQYGINWENPTFEGVDLKSRPSSMRLYGQSKAANIFQAKAWATRNADMVENLKCVSVSCYPGNIRTELQRDMENSMLMRFLKPLLYGPEYGAYTELYAALSSELTSNSQGAYVVPFGKIHEPREDIKAGLQNGTDLKLWDWVEKKIENYF